MNIIDTFQDLVGQVNEFVQPLIIAAAGAVPFVEGEGAASIGVLGGVNPVVAAISAIVGNFLCVAVLVLLSSRARTAVVTRNRARSEARVVEEQVAAVGGSGSGGSGVAVAPRSLDDGDAAGTRSAVRRAKFQRAFERYGVPGVCLLGPLLLPPQSTATMLAASGIGRARVLFWQGVAIVGWTTLVTLLMTGVVSTIR